ncbi:MAG: hypothetical protein H0W15_10700 [Gemmatimonadales bacterium]|nr:hypothetical protein [Gemmatimonadales bacterium]
MFLAPLCALLLAAGTVDTTHADIAGGPRIASIAIGLRPLAREQILSPHARRGDSQLTAGLIGAALLATVSVVMVNGWNQHDEVGAQSLVLTAGAAAAAGFVIGVLIAGPSERTQPDENR